MAFHFLLAPVFEWKWAHIYLLNVIWKTGILGSNQIIINVAQPFTKEEEEDALSGPEGITFQSSNFEMG